MISSSNTCPCGVAVLRLRLRKSALRALAKHWPRAQTREAMETEDAMERGSESVAGNSDGANLKVIVCVGAQCEGVRKGTRSGQYNRRPSGRKRACRASRDSGYKRCGNLTVIGARQCGRAFERRDTDTRPARNGPPQKKSWQPASIPTLTAFFTTWGRWHPECPGAPAGNRGSTDREPHRRADRARSRRRSPMKPTSRACIRRRISISSSSRAPLEGLRGDRSRHGRCIRTT